MDEPGTENIINKTFKYTYHCYNNAFHSACIVVMVKHTEWHEAQTSFWDLTSTKPLYLELTVAKKVISSPEPAIAPFSFPRNKIPQTALWFEEIQDSLNEHQKKKKKTPCIARFLCDDAD